MARRNRADKKSNEHFIPKQNCPYCGYFHDCASALDGSDDKPEPGEVSLCLCCMEIAVYGKDMVVRLPTAEEWLEIRQSGVLEKIEGARNFRRFMQRRHG